MNISIPTMYPHQPMPPHGYQNYYQPTMAVPLPVANPVPDVTRPGNCYMSVRQQPREAQVTDEGKEKVRKPIDPPPILQLKTYDNTEPSSNILQNPYIFVSATLYKAERNEPVEHTPNKSLAGTLVSSMHRLKDIDNKDGGFFVFGDISVRLKGTFRLCFTMYEFQPSQGEFQHLSSIISEKFDVVPSKDFKGLEESTYLSRAFSDQGVRLRLRKESRGMMKRGNETETESSKRKREDYILPPSVDAPSMTSFQSPTYEFQSSKRRREDYMVPPSVDANYEFQSSKRRREDYVPFQSGTNPYVPHPYPVYQMSYPMVPTYEPDDGLG